MRPKLVAIATAVGIMLPLMAPPSEATTIDIRSASETADLFGDQYWKENPDASVAELYKQVHSFEWVDLDANAKDIVAGLPVADNTTRTILPAPGGLALLMDHTVEVGRQRWSAQALVVNGDNPELYELGSIVTTFNGTELHGVGRGIFEGRHTMSSDAGPCDTVCGYARVVAVLTTAYSCYTMPDPAKIVLGPAQPALCAAAALWMAKEAQNSCQGLVPFCGSPLSENLPPSGKLQITMLECYAAANCAMEAEIVQIEASHSRFPTGYVYYPQVEDTWLFKDATGADMAYIVTDAFPVSRTVLANQDVAGYEYTRVERFVYRDFIFSYGTPAKPYRCAEALTLISHPKGPDTNTGGTFETSHPASC